jgi:hypothetical protein
MLKANEILALQFVLSFVDTKSLLMAAADGFSATDGTKNKDTIEMLNKAIFAYLK